MDIKEINEKLKIVKLKDVKFKVDNKSYCLVSGYCFEVVGEGYVAFDDGLLVPYIPCGGKKALEAILKSDSKGFNSFEGMLFVKSIGA